MATVHKYLPQERGNRPRVCFSSSSPRGVLLIRLETSLITQTSMLSSLPDFRVYIQIPRRSLALNSLTRPSVPFPLRKIIPNLLAVLQILPPSPSTAASRTATEIAAPSFVGSLAPWHATVMRARRSGASPQPTSVHRINIVRFLYITL